MSNARANLRTQLDVLRDCLAHPVVADGAPVDVHQNAIAAQFRNGLAVICFAVTEAFIRDRTAEVLRGFSNTAVSFADLSDKLQQAATISALQGVLFRAKFQEKAMRVAWTLAELPPIANAAINVSSLSPYAFGQSNSNLSEDVLPEILAAFGIEGGWGAISEIAKRIGLGGIPDYSQAFKELAKRRHAAAHDVSVRIPLNDLTNSLKSVLGICCPFDLILSHALSKHNIRQIPNNANGLITHKEVKLRFLSPHPSLAGKIREQVEQLNSANHRTVKVHPDLPSAKAGVLPRTRAQKEQLIQLGTNGIPDRWQTW